MMLKCPSCSADLIDPAYDAKLNSVLRLRWAPWVGRNYSRAEPGKRILIVGESHYERARGNESFDARRGKLEKQKEYTREMIWEGVFSGDLESRTYDMVPIVMVGDGNYCRNEFWGSVAYYNLIQRMLNYDAKPPERPTKDDFVQGWTVFSDVAKILLPDCCVFLGSTAHRYYWAAMNSIGSDFIDVKRREKVGRCWGYRAGLEVANSEIPLVFIQHPGKYFSPSGWHQYLMRELPSEISDVRNRSIVR